METIDELKGKISSGVNENLILIEKIKHNMQIVQDNLLKYIPNLDKDCPFKRIMSMETHQKLDDDNIMITYSCFGSLVGNFEHEERPLITFKTSDHTFIDECLLEVYLTLLQKSRSLLNLHKNSIVELDYQ